MDGMNVSDYVYSDIELKLTELEEEKSQYLAEIDAANMGGGGVTMVVSTKRRRRPCNVYRGKYRPV